MGITGLIPFLEKASSQVNLKDFRGSTVAIDTYCWLHKGVFACAEKLARGEKTDLYLQYCLKYVQLLLSHDIKPILVFDGRHLPAKAITEKRRRESRQQSKKLAVELLRMGKVEEARSHMRRSIDVTHEMALNLIRECRRRNVDCIVAPYEADAQLAWLNKINLAQHVITEDSDLILFGARSVIFKLDLTGGGLLIESDKLHLAMGCREERYTFDRFRRMCILSGCDYLDSLPGIGLAKACKFMLITDDDNMGRALRKIPQYLNMRTLEVADEYIENFHKAEATFKHMYIYNPLKRKMERIHELYEYATEERYCSNAGILLEDAELAFQLALGNLNPFSLKQLDYWDPDKDTKPAQKGANNVQFAKHKSIWLANYEPHTRKKSDDKVFKDKPASCALLFKKVDFISQTIIEDIKTSNREEQEKPKECDIFAMYRDETAADNKTSHKKRSRQSSSSSADNAEEITTPSVSSKTNRVNHNPFAKTNADFSQQITSIASKQRNSYNEETIQNSVDNMKPEQIYKNVEVKSRFFSENVKQVLQTNGQKVRPIEDLSNEIEKIEILSQQKQDQQLLLYNHGSATSSRSQNSLKKDDVDLTTLDVTIQPSEIENVNKINNTNSICQQLEISNNSLFSINKKHKEDKESIIILSDESTSDVQLHISPIKKVRDLEKFKQRGPRLGLTKPKTAGTKTKKNNASLNENQTRLSMFGFHKKPKLQ